MFNIFRRISWWSWPYKNFLQSRWYQPHSGQENEKECWRRSNRWMGFKQIILLGFFRYSCLTINFVKICILIIFVRKFIERSHLVNFYKVYIPISFLVMQRWCHFCNDLIFVSFIITCHPFVSFDIPYFL